MELDFGTSKVSVSGREIILGRSDVGGRDVLVADYVATLKAGTFEIPMRGYSLVDIDTGIRLYFDATAAGSILIKDKHGQLKMRQITTTNLPPKSKEVPATSERTVRKRLEDVKRLLDQKLITPDEAAEKRREILNSL